MGCWLPGSAGSGRHWVVDNPRFQQLQAIEETSDLLGGTDDNRGWAGLVPLAHGLVHGGPGDGVGGLGEVIEQAHRGIQRVRDTPHLAYSFLRRTGLSVS
jgi:hypothetical protein